MSVHGSGITSGLLGVCVPSLVYHTNDLLLRLLCNNSGAGRVCLQSMLGAGWHLVPEYWLMSNINQEKQQFTG